MTQKNIYIPVIGEGHSTTPTRESVGIDVSMTWAARKTPAEFGVGQAIFSDYPGIVCYSNGSKWYNNGADITNATPKIESLVILSSTNTAAQNSTLIQDALNLGGDVNLYGDGVCLINTTLQIKSNTNLYIDNGLTIKLSNAGVAKTMFCNSAYKVAKTAVTVTWTSGQQCTVNEAGHNRLINTYIWLTSDIDPEFNGIFKIKTVTDSNNYIVALWRVPTVAPTGTLAVTTPNENITITGYGTINYDGANHGGGADGPERFAVILSGVVGLKIERLKVINAKKYCLNVCAVINSYVKNLYSPTTLSDMLKVYGPIKRLDIDGVSGYSIDDVCSIQTHEGAGFLIYDHTHGDLFDIVIRNVTPIGTVAASVVIYATYTGYYIDNISVEDCVIYKGTTVRGCDAAPASKVGTVKYKNISVIDPVAYGEYFRVSSYVDVNTLVYEDINFTGLNVAGNVGVDIFANTIVRNLYLNNCKFESKGNTLQNLVQFAGIELTNVYIDKLKASIIGTGNSSKLVRAASGIVGNLFVGNSKIESMYAVFDLALGVTGSRKCTVQDSELTNVHTPLNTEVASTLILNNNEINNPVSSGRALRCNGAGVSFAVKSKNNRYSGNFVPMTKLQTTELVSWDGTDIPVDITTLVRTAGSMCKTSAVAGTIVIGEIAVCDVTNNTNSWKQLTNTTNSY